MANKKRTKPISKPKKKKGAKNKKYGNEIKVKAILLYAINGNIAKTALEIGVAKSTVHRWINSPELSEQMEQIRTEKSMEFADKASEIINNGLELLDRRINIALEREKELELLLLEIAKTPNGEISKDVKANVIEKIKRLELQRLGEITTAVGTLFDKRALARGEKTSDIGITIEDLIKPVQGDEY